MSFEDKISSFNETFFFREFTFSKNKFRPTPNDELEFADNVLWIDDLLVIYQLKERDGSIEATVETEEKWFNNKVIGDAKRQIRNTLEYLKTCPNIHIENRRGHAFDVVTANLKSMHKVILYLPNELLPTKCFQQKYYKSNIAGIIHLFSDDDYRGICKTLITPAELHNYLFFREKLITIWGKKVFNVSEQAIVGQYLIGDENQEPSEKFTDALLSLKNDSSEWDMSGIISVFQERITYGNSGTDYYSIITEVAKLNRGELRDFKTRFGLSMEKAQKNELVQPYRIASPRTGCGFVFIPVTKELIEMRINGLENFTHAHKYDLRLGKCLGISFAYDHDGWFLIDWCFIEFPWKQDSKLEHFLNDNNPFRPIKTGKIPTYSFERNS